MLARLGGSLSRSTISLSDSISKAELLARLAEGHAARLTVVTPNRRLAQALRAQFDARQAEKGFAAWEDADVLPFGAFLERLYEDALHSGLAARVPPLLAEAQEAALWESVVAASHPGLLDTAAAAAQCAEAWRLAHAWRIEGAIGKFAGNDDHEAFAAWSRAYRERTAGETDLARLPDLVAGWLGEGALRKPSLLVACGFDLLPPQTEDFFKACERHGIEVRSCAPAAHAAAATRVSFASPRAELEAAARWARARLEAGARRIGVVVPELGERRKEVARVFSRTLQPARHLPGARDEPRPFNLSLGAPLAGEPVVHAALAILELSFHEMAFADASRLFAITPLARASRMPLHNRFTIDCGTSWPLTDPDPAALASFMQSGREGNSYPWWEFATPDEGCRAGTKLVRPCASARSRCLPSACGSHRRRCSSVAYTYAEAQGYHPRPRRSLGAAYCCIADRIANIPLRWTY